MKRVLMAITVLASLSTVACGDKKKQATQQEMIHACLWDQTGNCQRQAAQYAASPAVLPLANQVGNNPALLAGIQNGTIPVVVPPAGTPGAVAPVVGGGVAIASVSDAALKAQQQKVAAAIAADSNNPNSIHYDPPRAPASVQPASVASDASPSAPPASAGAIGGPGDGIR